MSAPRDRQTYRGYYILLNPFTGVWYISKETYHIASAGSFNEAMAIVDDLLEPK